MLFASHPDHNAKLPCGIAVQFDNVQILSHGDTCAFDIDVSRIAEGLIITGEHWVIGISVPPDSGKQWVIYHWREQYAYMNDKTLDVLQLFNDEI